MEARRQQWLTTDEWAIPEPADADPETHVEWAPTWLPRVGKLPYTG